MGTFSFGAEPGVLVSERAELRSPVRAAALRWRVVARSLIAYIDVEGGDSKPKLMGSFAMFDEYLFVDKRRLESYASQVNPSGNVVEKAKEWNIDVSLTGPKAGAKQTERVRPMTEHEKMTLILGHLRQHSKLREARPLDNLLGPEFVLEQCQARKIIVPSKAHGADNPSFVFWLSPGPEHNQSPGMLCLLQDFRNDDASAEDGEKGEASTYTLLQSLLYFSRSKISESILCDTLPKLSLTNPYAKRGDRPASNFEESVGAEKYAWDFVTRPFELLAEWGCLVSASRTIETLYRIREYGRDATAGWTVTTIFGYPVWVRALET